MREWREPYDAAAAAQLRELASACAAARGRFGFALSPGLDIDYGSADDRAALLAKLVPLLDSGVDWLVLALDDIPPRPNLAADQVELTNWLLDVLRGRDAGVRLTLVPTEYVGTRPSDYLSDLARGLPADVDVMWTGPTVCSPRITTDDALAWQSAVGGHPLLLWDNYPVNDGVMARELHLGAYRGRDAGLAGVLDGVLCNPMVQPRASLVALATVAEFLCDPAAYDEDAAWERAIAAVGGKRATSLQALARGLRGRAAPRVARARRPPRRGGVGGRARRPRLGRTARRSPDRARGAARRVRRGPRRRRCRPRCGRR